MPMVLLVDADPDSSVRFEKALRAAGYEVSVAPSASRPRAWAAARPGSEGGHEARSGGSRAHPPGFIGGHGSDGGDPGRLHRQKDRAARPLLKGRPGGNPV